MANTASWLQGKIGVVSRILGRDDEVSGPREALEMNGAALPTGLEVECRQRSNQ
jgi:hypothetical protein